LAYGISGIDAKTGTLLWEARIFDRRTVSSPVVAGNLVIGTCGEGGSGSLFAVRLGGKGDVTATHLAYRIDRGAPYVPTPVVSGDRMFLMSDKGIASAVEASTGKVIWTERVGGNFFGSYVLVEGRLYIMSWEGECVVLEAGDQFRVLAKNPLGEGTYSTPCVDGGRFYLKTHGHLLCVGGK
jgi:outer membrane protein assembly factor BamB